MAVCVSCREHKWAFWCLWMIIDIAVGMSPSNPLYKHQSFLVFLSLPLTYPPSYSHGLLWQWIVRFSQFVHCIWNRVVYAADGTMQFLRKDLILNSRLVRSCLPGSDFTTALWLSLRDVIRDLGVLCIQVHYFYIMKQKVGKAVRPHFSEVLKLVPNEMLELSGGLPHRKECRLVSSTVFPEQCRFFWSRHYSARL